MDDMHDCNPYSPGRNVWRLPRSLVLLAIIALLLCVACSQDSAWQVKDISGLMPRLAFSMTDETGQPIEATDLRGKIVVLYFGYTHCPDVCPTAMNRMAGILKELGETASRVRVLFVTVDPARDSEAVLAAYTEFFGPQFMGLHGSSRALRELTKRYRVSFGRGESDPQGRYAVSHSSAMFVFDAAGEPRLLITPRDTRAMVKHDLKHLLRLSPRRDRS